jgi:hypothetical protein
MGDLVPRRVVTAFKECLSDYEVLRSISDYFDDLGFQLDPDLEAKEGQRTGQRRALAAGYLGSLDLTRASDANRLLQAMSYKMAEWDKGQVAPFRQSLETLIRVLDVAGFRWDGRAIVRRAGPFASGTHGNALQQVGIDDVNREMERIQASVESDPADAITAARSLLETVCKAALEELGEQFGESDDLPNLYKKTALALKFDATQHEVVYRQTLQGLASAVQGLAELRNKLGDAHGHTRAAVRPQPRHARMAAGAAMTVATFIVETLEARRAP